MVIGMDDFIVGEWYGIYTESTGMLIGYLAGKEHIEGLEGQEDRLVMKVTNSNNTIKICLDAIQHYSHFQHNGTAAESKIYNDALNEYGIKCGDTMTQVLNKYIDNWNDYDTETKDFLVGKISQSICNYNLRDLLDSLVSYKKYFDEEHQNYIDVLKNQMEFMENYKEFKESLPDGIGKIYDLIIFDVCKLRIGE